MLKFPNDPRAIPIAGEDGEFDEYFKQVVEVVCQYEKANAPLIQRRLSVDYARAERIMDQLQEAGVIGLQEWVKPRQVLIHSVKELFGKGGAANYQLRPPAVVAFSLRSL